jgi:hypothetical protein
MIKRVLLCVALMATLVGCKTGEELVLPQQHEKYNSMGTEQAK